MAGAPTAILAYHRVGHVEYDPLRLAVTPATLAAHLRQLAGIDVVPLRDLLVPSDRRRVALTFDDGYDDNRTSALPLLSELAMPCTLFVVANMLAPGSAYWWDRVTHLVAHRPAHARDLLDRLSTGPISRLAARLPWRRLAFRTLFLGLRDLPVAEIDALLGGHGVSPPDGLPPLLDAARLHDLARRPGVEIGAHSCSHARLSTRTAADQEREVIDSKSALEAKTGLSVQAFAYPYGDRASYCATTIDAVRRAGFDVACVNHLRSAAGPHTLPRLTVFEWDVATFRRRLEGAFTSSVS